MLVGIWLANRTAKTETLGSGCRIQEVRTRYFLEG